MRYFVIPNWGEYQHYKDRNPPWIKLHVAILSSETWVALDDASRVLAVACMVLASKNGGKVPADSAYVRRVAYLNSDPDFKPLIYSGFLADPEGVLADASVLLADASTMQADARPEERRGETETEERQNPRKRGAGAIYRYAEFRAIYPEERALPEAKAMNWWVKNVQWGDDAKVEQILANTRIWNGTEQFRDGKAWNIGKYLSEGMVFNPPKQAAPARPVQQEDDVAITLRLLREGRAAALADEAAAKAAAGAQ